jgi:glycine/D-amino acid oxidase-like deaminating enzyme
MKVYDWVVIGAGITGSTLAYELSKKNFKVLLLEKDSIPDNATLYSYGGLAYWSGTTSSTRQLCQEGIEIHRNLSEELEADTEFRELDLVLTIDVKDNPQQIVSNYSAFAITPELLDVQAACELEPLLNPSAIAGILRLPHGHIHPQKTTEAYQQAFIRQEGEIKYEQVINFVCQGDTVVGLKTLQNTYHSANTVVCAGGLSRSLLQQVGISVPNYFTHAQLIRTPPIKEIKLRTLVMPAVQQRFIIEAETGNSEIQFIWEKEENQIVASILDPGAIQFLDGSFCLGQISTILPNPWEKLAGNNGEAQIRQEIGKILPSLAKIQGTFHHCLVAFAKDNLSLIGNCPNLKGIYLFSGFTSTLVFAPPLARQFADWATGNRK